MTCSSPAFDECIGVLNRKSISAVARRRWTLIAAILGLNITILDETVVFLALPAINRDLGVALRGQQWTVNGYLLSLSALLLVAGSLADRFGRRRLFLYARPQASDARPKMPNPRNGDWGCDGRAGGVSRGPIGKVAATRASVLGITSAAPAPWIKRKAIKCLL